MIPLIAAMLQAGLPAIANAVMEKGKDWVEAKTGITLPDDATEKLTPEQIASMRVAEIRHRDVLASAVKDITIEEIRDGDAARQFQVNVLEKGEGWFAKNFIYLMTSFWCITTATYIGFITFGTVPEKNQRFADTILGFLLGTAIAAIFNFFYGSSKSSASKDGTVARLLDRLSAPLK